MTERDKLDLAREQLARVQSACIEPIDWLDVVIYGFYALENAVVAAADLRGVGWRRTHPSKVAAAQSLTTDHGFPDVATLLLELNDLRKSEAYGEILAPTVLEASEIAQQIEEYVEAVEDARSHGDESDG